VKIFVTSCAFQPYATATPAAFVLETYDSSQITLTNAVNLHGDLLHNQPPPNDFAADRPLKCNTDINAATDWVFTAPYCCSLDNSYISAQPGYWRADF